MPVVMSVIVCTYNRSQMLEGCLQSLFEQVCDSSKYEVILVDNNSSDDTHAVANVFLENPHFRYYLEEKQGLSIARNHGLAKAKGEYIAYIDDDVLLPQDWIKTALNLIQTLHPPLDGLGGPLYPFYTTTKPDWFEDSYAVQMGTRTDPYFLQPGQSFIGANMIWEKALLIAIGGFKPELGYRGNTQTLGEETDAYYRAWSLKPSARFYFSPDLKVMHWLPPEKMSLSYQINRYFKYGLTNYCISSHNIAKPRFRFLCNRVMVLAKRFVKALLAVRKYRQWQKWVFNELPFLATVWGEILGILGMKP